MVTKKAKHPREVEAERKEELNRIPKQLRNPYFRFIKIAMQGDYARKRPLEKKWQNINNYPYDDSSLTEYISKGDNYGIVCGYGDLSVIDADEKEIEDIVEINLKETFTVQTGSGGKHYYFIIPDLEKKIVLHDKDKKHFGEIQFTGSQVIAPGCLHPNNKNYKIIKDVPIATIKYSALEKALGDYIQREESTPEHWENNGEFQDIDITKVISLSGLTKHGNEYQGKHPIHGSRTGNNFCINPSKGTWHCFRCNSGGGSLSLIAVLEGIINCSDAKHGALRGNIFKEVIKKAVDKYKFDIDLKTYNGSVEEIITTLTHGSLTVEVLDPDSAWKEIKAYEMNEDFVLQPVYNPVRGKREVTGKDGNIETKSFEDMSILLLCIDNDKKRRILYPYTGKFSDSTVYLNDSKYKIPSEPFNLKSLPSAYILSRFLQEEKIDGKKIWNLFKKYRKTYLDVGEDNRKYIMQTAWDLGTYFYMVFTAYPYQNYYGLRGSGKNRAHEISNELCFHTQMIATTRSISSIFRSIDAMGSTWLKNEAETLIGRNRDDDLLELCLEGYKEGSSVPLTSEKGKSKARPPLYFDVYSPKSFASDKNIYGAFGTRMIKYLMQKTAKDQGKKEIDKQKARDLRDLAYLLRLQDGCNIAQKTKIGIDELLKDHNLKLVSREREIFFPLLVIIKEYASKEEFDLAIEWINDYLEQQRQESIDEPIAIILRALYTVSLEQQAIQDKNKELWINIYDIRKKIVYDDPEAWRLVVRDHIESREIIKTSETARYFSCKKIGKVLSDLGFNRKKRAPSGYQRKIDINKILSKANTLNISLKDLHDKEKEGFFNE